MPNIPRATTTVSDTAGAVATGLDTVCVIAACPENADITPRLFGNAKALYEQHGYCEGLEYSATHFQRTRRNVLFVGLPIDTPGSIGREDTSGNSGTSVTTLSAGPDGVLAEHDGEVSVITGGTIGTDQIVLGVSADGGRQVKRVRLGTANSYTIPYIGVAIGFGAGNLVAGDVIHTWHGSAPRISADDLAAARTALAAQLKFFRSIKLIGDLQSSSEAEAFRDQLDAYETENERFVQGRASVRDRLPLASMSHVRARMTGNPSLTFAEVGATGDTITRSAGSWITDGFVVGDTVIVTGSVGNNVTGVVTGVSATVLTFDTTDLAAEGPVANVTVTAEPTLTFAEVGASGDTLTRSRGSWLEDGFRVGDTVAFDGTASNDALGGTLTGVTATVLTFGGGSSDLAAEVIGAYGVDVTAGETKAAWMADIDAEFAPLSDDKRVNLSAGRMRTLSPFSGWNARRPVSWFASWREYQHDLHVATWRKDDGPVDGDLFDEEGNLVEWDDRVDGGAGSAARFTTARTYANGPQGGFITMDLTRAEEGSPLLLMSNMHVTNLACTTVQLNTELAIGRSLVLQDDGRATEADLKVLEAQVNAALDLALLQNARGEGPRASKAVWTASRDDILNTPEATLNGVLDLNLNGTIHSVNTSVRVRAGGQ